MSLSKKLQREIRTNPVKAVSLSVLLVVAAYFWAPLLTGSPEAPLPSAAIVNPAFTGPVAQQPGFGEARYDWQSAAKSIDSEPKMQPSAKLRARDPFETNKRVDLSRAEEKAAVATSDSAPISPAEVGLTLDSTLIGTWAKIAQIGGRSYRVGNLVEAAVGDSEATFRLVDIKPRLVVLEREGKRYELRIPRPLVDVLSTEGNDKRSPTAAHRGASTSSEGGATADEPSETRTSKITDD